MTADRPSLAMLSELGPTRAAAFWLERLQRDDIGEDDALFQQWLSGGDAHRRAWDRALDLWDVFEESDDEGVFTQMRREALRLRRRRPPGPTWYAGAAAAAAAAAVAIISSTSKGPAEPHLQTGVANNTTAPAVAAAPPQRYATTADHRDIVALGDGSKVELDGASAIEVAYGANVRAVRLVRGHAFFDVAHAAARPFRVAAAGRVVSDLGTSFDIRVASDGTRIVLVRGAISVSEGDDPARTPEGPVHTLIPGEQLFARAGQPDTITRVDLDRVSQWRQRVLQFDDTPLGAAVAELDRYADDQLIIRDPAVSALRVSGAFRTGDTKRFGQTLTALYPVRLAPLGDGRIEIVHAR